MPAKRIVIDGKDHLFGRLGSIVAKHLLLGNEVIVVRAERIVISGSMFRNLYRIKGFLGKTRSANPRRGHIHYHNPARIFWRAIRGMTPHKTPRGTKALARLKVFEGIPQPYAEMKRLVVPDALKSVRIKNFRKVTMLGDLATRIGWKYQKLVDDLEEKRKAKSAKYYEAKLKKDGARAGAQKSDEVKKIEAELAEYGF